MKKHLFLILGSVISIFTSCDLSGDYNYKPDIVFLQNPIVINRSDTLGFTIDAAGEYMLDTIRVGDTVSFFMVFDGYSNHLTELNIIQSLDSVSSILLPPVESLDTIFSSTSNYNQGKFVFGQLSNQLYFPFSYVAKKASLEAKLIFKITSDANFEYNQNTFLLRTPISPALEQ